LSIVVAVTFWLSARGDSLTWRRARLLVLALAPSCAVFAMVAASFDRAGYSAPLDASARSAVDAWQYVTREGTMIWTALLLVAVVSLAASWRWRGEVAWLLSASLIVPAGLLLMFTGQPRLAPPLLVGTVVAAALGARRIAATGVVATIGTTLIAVEAAFALGVAADRAAAHFASFYQVTDPSLVAAADAIAADGLSGAVAVRQDRRGWPIGWWFEALLERPVLVGSDRRWLAFPEEWDAAAQTAALFDGGLNAGAFREQTTEAGVRYLVTPKWDWIGWERWSQTPEFPVSVVFDDDRYLVLRVT
jgi:hypothetical protein